MVVNGPGQTAGGRRNRRKAAELAWDPERDATLVRAGDLRREREGRNCNRTDQS